MMTAYEWEMAMENAAPEYVQTRVTKSSGSEAMRKMAEKDRLRYGVKKEFDPDFEYVPPVRHIDVIMKALSEGKTINPLVMQDYPELKKKIAKTEISKPEIIAKAEERPLRPAYMEPTLPAYMSDQPFTSREMSMYNSYTHFERDFNKEYTERIGIIENEYRDELKNVGYDTFPKEAQEAMIRYRKALHDYYLTTFKIQAYAPPMYVVGPSKYPTGRREKANRRDEKNRERLEKAEKQLKSAMASIKKMGDPVKIREAKQTDLDQEMLVIATRSTKNKFGDMWGKQKLSESPNLPGTFIHVLRKQGREKHKALIEIAIDRGMRIEYLAIKDYTDLITKARNKGILEHEPPGPRLKEEKKAEKPFEFDTGLQEKWAKKQGEYSRNFQAEYDNEMKLVEKTINEGFKSHNMSVPPEAVRAAERYKNRFRETQEKLLIAGSYLTDASYDAVERTQADELKASHKVFTKILDNLVGGSFIKPKDIISSEGLKNPETWEIENPPKWVRLRAEAERIKRGEAPYLVQVHSYRRLSGEKRYTQYDYIVKSGKPVFIPDTPYNFFIRRSQSYDYPVYEFCEVSTGHCFRQSREKNKTIEIGIKDLKEIEKQIERTRKIYEYPHLRDDWRMIEERREAIKPKALNLSGFPYLSAVMMARWAFKGL